MQRVLVVIPAFNEKGTLGHVIDSLPKFIGKNIKVDVLVVDDGSSDATAKVAYSKRVYVIRHLINRGLGAALGTGFTYGRTHGYDYVVTFDADGQHQAQDIANILAPLIDGKADVTIGSRLLTSQPMPFLRKIINQISNIITFLLFNIWTTDSQSGLRGFTKSALTKVRIRSERMEVSSEVFKEIRRLNLRFVEVPIAAYYSEYSLHKGQPLTNAPYVFWKLILNRLT